MEETNRYSLIAFSLTSTGAKRKTMKLFTRIAIFFIVLPLLVSSCAPKASFDIRGEWTYTMISADGNTYDTGAITFSGQPNKGTYLEVNIYEVEYNGGFTVNGTTLNLNDEETWIGTISDANTISGVWSHSDGVSGTFTAARK